MNCVLKKKVLEGRCFHFRFKDYLDPPIPGAAGLAAASEAGLFLKLFARASSWLKPMPGNSFLKFFSNPRSYSFSFSQESLISFSTRRPSSNSRSATSFCSKLEKKLIYYNIFRLYNSGSKTKYTEQISPNNCRYVLLRLSLSK